MLQLNNGLQILLVAGGITGYGERGSDLFLFEGQYRLGCNTPFPEIVARRSGDLQIKPWLLYREI